LSGLPLSARLANALVSYCRYLEKLFWPTNLCAYYPHPGQWPTTAVVWAGSVLTGISILVFWLRRRSPYLLTGWLWFVGSLVPVMGWVQVGAQAMADRYTYLPSIGVFVALVWGLSEWAEQRRVFALSSSVAAIVAVGLCAAVTRRQIAFWKDSEAVFRHTLAVTEGNDLAHNNLGTALLGQERWAEAAAHFQSALLVNPRSAEAHYNLGVGWFQQGQLDKAAGEFRSALTLRPAYQEAHYNLGVALLRQGALDEAISELREAVRLKPDDPEANRGLSKALELKNASGSPMPAASPP
jgi:tetratricopeptide (TPR) repeat protein